MKREMSLKYKYFLVMSAILAIPTLLIWLVIKKQTGFANPQIVGFIFISYAIIIFINGWMFQYNLLFPIVLKRTENGKSFLFRKIEKNLLFAQISLGIVIIMAIMLLFFY